MRSWTRFFLVRLPIAVLAIEAVAEVAAWSLAGVTLHRHNVDDLANAVLHDPHPYRVVLLGDSVTHIVAQKYRIGDRHEVADLTTHAKAGLPSSLFLLKRYLESGHRPRQVDLAASRGVFVEPMEKDTFTYYVTSVFTRPYERQFLRKYYGDYVDYAWRPAALAITTRIGEPLFSLLRHPGDELWTAPDTPAATPSLENFADDPVDPTALRDKVGEPAVIRPEVRAILEEMCSLSRRYGFSLHIIWAPEQSRVRSALEANGKARYMNEQLRSIFAAARTNVTIDDSSGGHDFPYFDRDLIHIKGEGWEQLYAVELTSFIHRFEGRGDQSITARK